MLGHGFDIPTLAVRGQKSKFSPSSVASLAAWYDPSDVSTLFQDAAGTIAAASDGDQVQLMLDKSGNARSAVHVATNAPILRISGAKTWLEFSNSAGFILPANTFGTLAYSVFLGFGKTVSVAGQANAYPHFWRTTNDAQSFFMRSGGDRLELKAQRVGGSDVRPVVNGFNALHSIGDKNVIGVEVGTDSGEVFSDGLLLDTKVNNGSAITSLSSASELMSNIEGEFFGAVLLGALSGLGGRAKINEYLMEKF